MRTAAKCLAVAALLLLPAPVLAQATLTGTVRDTSGAVLPGVTVEASSPALIEKVRSAVTDGTGQYRIIDLRPGTYTVAFTLPGFNTITRENIQLSGSQTITIPAEMRVGGLQETITVTGETPVVDVQNSRREIVMNDEVIQAIPVTRAAGALLNLTPGINVAEVSAGALSPTMTAFNARSSTINSGTVAGEGRYAVNGFPVTAARSGGFSSYVYDTVNAEEVGIIVGGGLGDSDIGGPVMNIIPRSGGNTFSGTTFLNTAGKWSSADNLTDEIQALNPNLRKAAGVVSAYDWSTALGGPIVKDRLWFYGGYRDLSTSILTEGISANANAGNPNSWHWLASPIEARNVKDRTMYIGRITGQFGDNRVRYNTEVQLRCEGTPLKVDTQGCHNRGEGWIGLGVAGNNGQSPEATSTAGAGYFDVPFYLNQVSWTLPATSKLLFEAGFTPFRYQPIFGHPAPDGDTSLIPVVEQSNALACTNANLALRHPACNAENAATLRWAPVTNYRYRGISTWGPAKGNTDDIQGTVSYVTGSHNAKMGYQYRGLDLLDKDQANSAQLAYRFSQGVPNAVSYYMPNFGRRTVTRTHSFFIQDSWTRNRLTLQGALRYDRASSFAPVELNGTTDTSFLNPQPVTIQRTVGVDAYHDITPRAGVAYDVFGDGRTAVKFQFGKYLAYAANDSPYTSTNPGATIQRSVTDRGWTDADSDKIVDCNLLNPDANGECAATTGNNRNFGLATSASIVSSDVLSGWGVRPGDTQYTVSIQQQVLPRVSADASFTHRSFHGFFITDDINRHAGGTFSGSILQSYESYTVTAPTDPRLPNGGGYPIKVYVVTPTAGAVSARNHLVREETFGEPRKSVWDGFEMNVNARLRSGLTAQLGSSTGRAIVDTCATVMNYGNPDPRNCNNTEPWQTTIRGLASYTIPKVDVLVSATVRSAPPLQVTATWQVPTATVVTPLLGHAPFGSTANTNIVLTDNDHRIFADSRRTTIDMRLGKILRFGRTRTDIGVDLNNMLNTNYATAYNGTYIFNTDNTPRPSGFLTPTTLYNPRFVRFNITVNY